MNKMPLSYIISVVFLLLAIPIWIYSTTKRSRNEQTQEEEMHSQPAHQTLKADPVATSEWLRSLFTEADGKLLVCGKPPKLYSQVHVPVKATSEIKPRHRGFIINQAGLYPVSLGPTESGFEVSIGIPFYGLKDDHEFTGMTDHPKEKLLKRSGLRAIAESLHTHFTELSQSKPEHHRGTDNLGYPSEYYIWKIGSTLIILSAYDGNDSDGIYLQLTSDMKKLDRIRTMEITKKAIFKDWGKPMPHLIK